MIHTVGHSTYDIFGFVALLRGHSVDHVVDVRSLPGSRRCPQFNQENMSRWLPSVNIKYSRISLLGGYRKGTSSTDINDGWRNKSFRNYADYMQTTEFDDGLETLVNTQPRSLAIMCSESVPWRCHRSLIASALVLLKHEQVFHIMTPNKRVPHVLGKWGPMPVLLDNKVIFPK